MPNDSPTEIDLADLKAHAATIHGSVIGLIDDVSRYLPVEKVQAILNACEFGADAHSAQTRASGEPYISHPIAVARILADMNMGQQTIIAAVLHDVIEDTQYTRDDITSRFGEPVAALVDGVSKIESLEDKSKQESQADNVQKLLLAAAGDIRVILIKLADRLHNMRTLGPLRGEKRRRIARETMDIYSPIANRLGIYHIRKELENLCFATIYPWRYRILQDTVQNARDQRRHVMEEVEENLKAALEKAGIECDVASREKHLFGIYKKLRKKIDLDREVIQLTESGLEARPLDDINQYFEHVQDMYGLRVIVKNIDDCYRVLGIVHSLYRPVLRRFKDYIAIPKSNGYQSLHTGLRGPGATPVEVQIRTADMHAVAEQGIAAHWAYKANTEHKASRDRVNEWLRNLQELQQQSDGSVDFVEHVKVDLFPDQIYVFSPKGKIEALPMGATVVDFAYAIHSDVGNNAVSALVDSYPVPLRTVLSSGQTVKIITSPTANPSPAWLNFVVTAKARSNIRHYLKTITAEEARQMGYRLLNAALGDYGLSLEQYNGEHLQRILDEFELSSSTELLETIGLGDRVAALVARRFADEHGKPKSAAGGLRPPPVVRRLLGINDEHKHGPLMIHGTEGLAVSLGKCCHPLPGDAIVGYLSSGKGLVIHTSNCKNLSSFKKEPDKWVDVEWGDTAEQSFDVNVRMLVTDERGVLATLTTHFSDNNIDIINITIEERDQKDALITFTIAVDDRVHLQRVLNILKKQKFVQHVSRVR